MKQSGTIGKLVAVLVFIVAVIVLRDYLPSGKNKDETAYLNKWKGYLVDNVASLTVAKGETTLTITKDGSVWKVGNYTADGEAIKAWLTALIQPETPELISENKESQKRLGFEETTKKLIIKTSENKETALELGNVSGTGRYLKFAGEDAVYLVEGMPTTLDSTEAKDWLDKTITKWEQKDIQKIIVERGKIKTTLTQTDGKWFAEGKNEEIDTTPLQSLFMNVESLVTTGLAEDQKQEPKLPEVKIVVTSKDGDTTLLFSPLTDDQYIVTSSAKEGKYLIAKSTVDTLKIDPTSLKPKPTTTASPASTQK